ncbi:MAG: sulfite exporter TauE/SafE family protein [Saonia sp.]
MTLTLFLLLLFVGVANGFYSGLMGTGGNVILIPALDLVLAPFGMEEQELVKFIIAHSLFVTVFNGLSVSYKHYRINNFFVKEVLLIGIPAFMAAYIMSEIIKTSQWYDKLYFDLLFLFLILLVAIRFLFYKHVHAISNRQDKMQKGIFAYSGLGAFTGIVSALSGFGGGIVLIPSLTDIFGIPIKKVSSISIGVVMLLAISVSISYLNVGSSVKVHQILPNQFGYISLSLVVPILIGVFLAAPFGVRVGQRTSPSVLRLVFGAVMVLIGVKIIIGLL